MTVVIEVDEEVRDRLDSHREAGESYSGMIEELLEIYEQEGRFTREGYTE